MSFILAANWKMNLGKEASAALCTALVNGHRSLNKSEIWLTPSFTNIAELKLICGKSRIKIGAQNAHWAESGAFTGEISCSMLKECGADFAITGHSERRHVFFETNEMVFLRSEAVLKSGLDLIFCIGETLKEREAGKTEEVLAAQLSGVPKMSSQYPAAKLHLAYEPVWAIGTGKTANAGQISQAHDYIENYWKSNSAGNCPKILYGGSVNADNIAAISKLQNVSGALIGGASNTYTSFSAMISEVENS